MNGAGTSKPLDRGTIGPAGITTRVRCAKCRRIQSIGQFSTGSEVCITCKPKPAGWRRDNLNIIGEFK